MNGGQSLGKNTPNKNGWDGGKKRRKKYLMQSVSTALLPRGHVHLARLSLPDTSNFHLAGMHVEKERERGLKKGVVRETLPSLAS